MQKHSYSQLHKAKHILEHCVNTCQYLIAYSVCPAQLPSPKLRYGYVLHVVWASFLKARPWGGFMQNQIQHKICVSLKTMDCRRYECHTGTSRGTGNGRRGSANSSELRGERCVTMELSRARRPSLRLCGAFKNTALHFRAVFVTTQFIKRTYTKPLWRALRGVMLVHGRSKELAACSKTGTKA